MGTVEFYKMAPGGSLGHILERLPLAFPDEAAFVEWAQKALPARRGNPQVWEWPDAVRAIADGGAELYCWNLWDQMQAGKAVNAART